MANSLDLYKTVVEQADQSLHCLLLQYFWKFQKIRQPIDCSCSCSFGSCYSNL